jgi:hypothetical protein
MPVIPATQAVEIGRIKVQGQAGQKVRPHLKLGMVAHACHPSYMGGIGRKILVGDQFWAKR